MKTVILTEKPDQGRTYANALGRVTNKKSYCEVETDILDGDVVVTWGIGHLVSLAPMASYGKQYEKWDLNNLPFQPEKMIYEVSSKTKSQFNVVKKQLESADQIIIATDPDREGENIAYSIFLKCSPKVKNTPKKRLWINSMVAKEIQRGFKNLKDSRETYNYFKEAQTRQISDYLVGMNFTQYFTLLTQSKGLKGVYSLGRVQTPTNTIVSENDLAIKNFKEETFYKIYGHVNKDNQTVKFTNDTKYHSKQDLSETLKKYGLDRKVETTIKSIKKEMKAKNAPKLFSLGGIQSYANKKWKYSLDKTLKIAQSLYQSGYLSYPRTNTELITTNEFEYLKEHLEDYKQLLGLSFNNGHLEPRKRYVNNDKVLEHYAIIPTEDIADLSKLSKEQRNIYEAVVRNTVLMFADDYIYESTTVNLDINGITFKTNGNVPKKLGWTSVEELEEKDKKEDAVLPEFIEGERILFTPNSEEGKTKPPARLTEASLGGKGGMMEKLNLGTPATRSSIVKTLIDRGYIKVEKTKLYPTEKGLLLYDMTKNILIGKPEMTAKWEEYLAKIGNGEGTQQVFLNNIHNFINKTLTSLKSKSKGISSDKIEQVKKANQTEIGNYIIVEKAKVFECTNKENQEEKFVIFKNMSSKKIGKTIVKQLLENKKTKLVKGFTSKKGNKFDAYLVLNDGKVSMEFPNKSYK